MTPQERSQVRQDLELIGRFSRTYREQFAALIAELNAPGVSAQTGGKCLRMCVEAVDMLLAMQQRLAEVVGGMDARSVGTGIPGTCKRAA